MSDLRCFDDLDLFGAECTDALEEYEQDVCHRLMERRGSNLDDLSAGEAITDYLSSTINPTIATRRFEEEIMKDDRTSKVTVTFTQTMNGNQGSSYQVDINAETSDGLLLTTSIPKAGG